MKKLLLIAGPTATGKTSLGLQLASKFNGEILSADSRQIYKGMDIGTGKDIPDDFNFSKSRLKFKNIEIGYYSNGTKIWLVDLVGPDQEFNIAFYKQVAWIVIRKLWNEEKLPIIVGGTGLYFKSLTESIETIHIPPNQKLRKKLESQTIIKLQNKLKKINASRFKKMNSSDRQNPRRLIRAIEISEHQKRLGISKVTATDFLPREESVLWIGLRAPKSVLYGRIDKRVDRRLKQGAEQEVKKLIKKGYLFNLPAMSALGYRQWQPYFKGKKSKKEVIKRWKLDEYAYARRQLTWFKKNKKIKWFNVTEPEYKKKVVHRVKQWYSKS